MLNKFTGVVCRFPLALRNIKEKLQSEKKLRLKLQNPFRSHFEGCLELKREITCLTCLLDIQVLDRALSF